jgi:hypothetical protein
MLPITAEKKWCPFSLGVSNPEECGVSGDAEGNFNGKNVAVAAINRLANGSPHPDCMCVHDKCMHWAWRGAQQQTGFCTRLNDNWEDDEDTE